MNGAQKDNQNLEKAIKSRPRRAKFPVFSLSTYLTTYYKAQSNARQMPRM
jgi:hypothetical protein